MYFFNFKYLSIYLFLLILKLIEKPFTRDKTYIVCLPVVLVVVDGALYNNYYFHTT